MKTNWQVKNLWKFINKQNFFAAFVLLLVVLHGLFDSVFRVDNTTVFLVIILLLLPYLHLIRKIKFGDFEAEIKSDDIEKLGIESEQVLASSDDALRNIVISSYSQEEYQQLAQYISQLIIVDPVLAVVKIRIELEDLLRKIYKIKSDSNYEKQFLATSQLINVLENKEILSRDYVKMSRDVLRICNQVVHGKKISEKNARDLFIVANEIIAYLMGYIYGVKNLHDN